MVCFIQDSRLCRLSAWFTAMEMAVGYDTCDVGVVCDIGGVDCDVDCWTWRGSENEKMCEGSWLGLGCDGGG